VREQFFFKSNEIAFNNALVLQTKSYFTYCFANIGRYVGRSVRPSVDKIVSDNYLKTIYHRAFIKIISHADWSR